MELSVVKEYLKIDFDDDDKLLEMLLGAARKYLLDAIGYVPDETDERVKLILLVLISDWYEHREYIENNTSQKISQKVRYTVRSIILQLQYGQE